MRLMLLIVAATAALLVGAAPSGAHLITKPKAETLSAQAKSQAENLAHARYVCRRGGGEHRRWSCAAVSWLRRELRETKAAIQPRVSHHPLYSGFMCIHSHEGAWNANTGNGYYGGLQMDWSFMSAYGSLLLKTKGTADRWTPAEQIAVAIRAHQSGRGFHPWPNTARMCGLL